MLFLLSCRFFEKNRMEFLLLSKMQDNVLRETICTKDVDRARDNHWTSRSATWCASILGCKLIRCYHLRSHPSIITLTDHLDGLLFYEFMYLWKGFMISSKNKFRSHIDFDIHKVIASQGFTIPMTVLMHC